jgi:hypothetical protein
MSANTTPLFTRTTMARITGGLYVAYILASVLADVLAHIGMGKPQQVYETLVTDISAFRLGFVIAMVSAFLFIMTAWGLYVLLRPVNKDLALLFLVLNAIGVAIQCASMLPLLAAMLAVDPAGQMQVFSEAQIQGLALLSAGIYKTGFVTAQLFFGTWLFPLGYLVYKSRFLPRLLGALLMLDGVAVIIWFLQVFLLPVYPALKTPGLAMSFLAEVGLALWLLIMGAKAVEPETSVRAGLLT